MISPQVLAYAGPFFCYLLFLVVRSLIGAGEGIEVRWIYGVQVAMVAILLIGFRDYYTELRNSWPRWRVWAWSVVCGIFVFAIWIRLDQPWMKLGDAPGYSPLRADGTADPLLAGMRICGATFIVPVMEELFWRSFVMRWMIDHDFRSVNPRRITWLALLAVSLVFGLEHDLWFAGLLAGLAYGYLYIRSGSIWAPICAHAVTNGLLGIWVLAYARWEFW
ncbi:MAG: prenyl protease-related protein [Betaproteobacteria bacterium]|nr:prenyl protease-related protein [Betaproteobacteria bacterium]